MPYREEHRMASFNKSNFEISYRLTGTGDYDTSLYKWTMPEMFDLPQYGPMGGAFRAEVVQRKNGRYEPWVFVPKITMMHRIPPVPIKKDDVIVDRTEFEKPRDFTEPAVTLGRSRSFDEALRDIMNYVRQKVGQRAWVGHEDPLDLTEWWV